jgi:hypothetical protein
MADASTSVDGVLRALVRDAVVDVLRAELAGVRAQLEEVKRALPPPLGDVARAAEVTGLSPASVRRRIKDGTFPTVRVGGRVLVDLAKLPRPLSNEEIEVLARGAREP